MRSAAASYWIAAVLCLAAVALLATRMGNRHALQEIVQQHCVVDWVSRHDPAPCVEVVLPDPTLAQSGYAVLADRKGGAHFLLIPVRSIPGMESPLLFEPGAPNYFAYAWTARNHLSDVIGHSVPRGVVGLAVNPPNSRSQDQLHIHIECLSTEAVRAIDEFSDRLDDSWAQVLIGRVHFEGRRLMGEQLAQSPFAILAHDLPDVRRSPGDYTLLVAGRQFRDGPGFVLLTGTERAAELLMDSSCAAAREAA